MKKQYIFYAVVITASAFLLAGCTKKDPGYDTSKVKVVDSNDQQDTTNNDSSNQDSKSNDSSTSEDLGYLADPSSFSKDKQSVGESNDGTYDLTAVDNASQSGYHEFTFNIQATGDVKTLPLITAENVLDKGIIRLTLTGINKDNSGIAFQKSVDINKGAIGVLYHSVTSLENTSVYEVGISGNNPFKLTSQDQGDGMWSVTLDVAYDTTYSAPNIDFGSTEFSSDAQSIEGMSVDDGAKITGYSYSVSGGVLKFVYSVASGTSNPVPSVNASYDDQNILVVTFPSLTSDKIAQSNKSITLPAGIAVEVSRSDNSTTYKFGGIGGTNAYKLSASKSPNQVIVEIKL